MSIMNLTRARGWGLFMIVWGFVAFAIILSVDSVVLVALLVILGFSFIYYGTSMVRSGSFTELSIR